MTLDILGIFGKNDDKELEPQYYTSRTNIRTLNYKVYYMSKIEKILYFLAAFIIGGYCGYLFYGGLFQNEFHEPTVLTYICNTIISAFVGTLTGLIFLPIRVQQIIDKRQRMLKRQFRDMLESLSTSLGAGKNVNDSFEAVAQDMLLQYDPDEFINNELKVIISGIRNNQDIEALLYDFGRRSGVKDIVMFASIFRISYRKGGNIKEIIMNTNTIMKDKFEIAEEIETVITSTKSELYIMMLMPVAMVAMFKGMSPEFGANFSTLSGVIATTVSLVLYGIAFKVGRVIMEIKI